MSWGCEVIRPARSSSSSSYSSAMAAAAAGVDEVDRLLVALGATDVHRVRAWVAVLAGRGTPAGVTVEDLVLVHIALADAAARAPAAAAAAAAAASPAAAGAAMDTAAAAAEWSATADEALVGASLAAMPTEWVAHDDPGPLLSAAYSAAAAAAAAAGAALSPVVRPLALALCLCLRAGAPTVAVVESELVRRLGGGMIAVRTAKEARRWAAANCSAVLDASGALAAAPIAAPLVHVVPVPAAAPAVPLDVAPSPAPVVAASGPTFAHCVGDALQAATPALVAAVKVVHATLNNAASLASAGRACLAAVREREAKRHAAANAAVEAAMAATAPDGKLENHWQPLREMLLSCSGLRDFAAPRWEYEALVVCDGLGVVPPEADAGALVAIARLTVTTSRSTESEHRWTDGKYPLDLARMTTWEITLWLNALARLARTAGLTSMVASLPREFTGLDSTVVGHAGRRLEPVKPDHAGRRLEPVKAGHAGRQLKPVTPGFVDRGARCLLDERNRVSHPKDGETWGAVTRAVAFRIVMRAVELCHTLDQQALPRTAASAELKLACSASLAALLPIATTLAMPPHPAHAAAPHPTLDDADAFLGLDDSDTGPLLAVVAPPEAYGAFALLPLSLVVDTFCPSAPGAVEAAAACVAAAGLPPPDGGVEGTAVPHSPLWAAFQDAAARCASQVTLAPNLVQVMAALPSAEFSAALRSSTVGLPWAQPAVQVAGGGLLAESEVLKAAVAIVRQVALLLCDTAKAKRRPITVLLPRWGTYAHAQRDSTGRVAFVRPDHSHDVMFPALADAFLQALVVGCTTTVRVLVLTDDGEVAAQPAHLWLPSIMNGADALTVLVLEAVFEYHHLRRLTPVVAPSSGVHLRQPGGSLVPFVHASAGGGRLPHAGAEEVGAAMATGGGGAGAGAAAAAAAAVAASAPPLASAWNEAATNLAALRNAGLQLLFENLPEAVLESMAAAPVFATALAQLASDDEGDAGAIGTRGMGAVAALHFAIGGLPDAMLWPLVGNDDGAKAVGCAVVARRVAALKALSDALQARVLARAVSIFKLTLEHEERTGGSVAAAQFAWRCYAEHNVAVLRVEDDAPTRMTDVRTARKAAAAAHLAACIASGVSVADARAVGPGATAPVVVLLVDRRMPEEAVMNQVVKQLVEGERLRVVLLRTRLVAPAAAAGGGAAGLPGAAVFPHLEARVRLGAPSDEEWDRVRMCQLNVAQVLFPRHPRAELQRALDGHAAGGSTNRVFRRLHGMLTFARLNPAGEVVARLAQAAMRQWASDAFRRVYTRARSAPAVRAAVRAFLFAALVAWCDGGAVSFASLAAAVHAPCSRRLLFELAPEAEAATLGAAQELVLAHLHARSGTATVDDEAALVMPFAPAAVQRATAASVTTPPALDVGLSVFLRNAAASAVSAVGATLVPPTVAALHLPPGLPIADAIAAAVRDAVSDPATGSEEIWVEMMSVRRGGFMAFISRETAALVLTACLALEAEECAPAASTLAGGTAGLPPAGSSDEAASSPAAVGVFALSICLLHALLHDADALAALSRLDNRRSSDSELQGTLVWEAQAVFRRRQTGGGGGSAGGAPLLKRRDISPAINYVLQRAQGRAVGGVVVDAATAFSTHACRLVVAATAVWSKQWHVTSGAARLLFYFIDMLRDARSSTTYDAGEAVAAFGPLVSAAALHATAVGYLTRCYSQVGEFDRMRLSGTYDMRGNAERHLLAATWAARLQRVRGAGGAPLSLGEGGGAAAAAAPAAAAPTAPPSAREVAFMELSDVLVTANVARRWYAASLGPVSERPQRSAVVVDEAELWVDVLEGAQAMYEALQHAGVAVARAGAGRAPLADEPSLEDATHRAVHSSVVLRNVSAAHGGVPIYPEVQWVYSLAAAAEMADDLLRHLQLLLWQDAESATDGTARQDDTIARQATVFQRFVNVLNHGNPRRAYDEHFVRFEELRLEALTSRGAAALLGAAARSVVRAADAVWSWATPSDANGPYRDSLDRYKSMIRDTARASYVFKEVLLKHVEAMGYPDAALDLLVELTSVVGPSGEYSDATLKCLDAARQVARHVPAASEGNPVPAAGRLLFLAVLFCKLIAAGTGRDAGELRTFEELNGVIQVHGSEKVWKESHHHDEAFIPAYRLMASRVRPLPGQFQVLLRHRFSREREAEQESELGMPSLRVHGTVLLFQRVRGNPAQPWEGVLQLSGCGVPLYFRVSQEEERVLGPRLPQCGHTAVGYVDAVCARGHAGVYAVWVQADRDPATNSPLERLSLRDYLPLVPAGSRVRHLRPPHREESAPGASIDTAPGRPPGMESAGAGAAAAAAAAARVAPSPAAPSAPSPAAPPAPSPAAPPAPLSPAVRPSWRLAAGAAAPHDVARAVAAPGAFGGAGAAHSPRPPLPPPARPPPPAGGLAFRCRAKYNGCTRSPPVLGFLLFDVAAGAAALDAAWDACDDRGRVRADNGKRVVRLVFFPSAVRHRGAAVPEAAAVEMIAACHRGTFVDIAFHVVEGVKVVVDSVEM